MKLLKAAFAAALALSGLGIGGAALAAQGVQPAQHTMQPTPHVQGGGNDQRVAADMHRGRDDRRGWNNNRGRHNGWSNNRGRHHGWNNRGRRVCKTVWRHHHRERVCRWVRR